MNYSQYKILFNKPHFTGKESEFINDAVSRNHISGNGYYTRKCQDFFQKKYGFNKCLLTTSCTDALEMAALLIDIQPGDEVIIPSFTFVSSANAFMLRGAQIVFADSQANHPNVDPEKIEGLINSRTKAIVVVHYAGMSCDMDLIKQLSEKYGLYIIEDAAQAIDGYYHERPLGSIGHLSTFSFHETKNISSGEGGMLVVNDPKFEKRAEIIWEKGTNRAAFFRGEINKYGWVDVGSSFLPSDLVAAVLWAQLEAMDNIQMRRKELWSAYFRALKPLSEEGRFDLPIIPPYNKNNAHMFFLIMPNLKQRSLFIQRLKDNGILATFHYQSLHQSEFFKHRHDGRLLPNADKYTDCLVRLPLYYDLDIENVIEVIKAI